MSSSDSLSNENILFNDIFKYKNIDLHFTKYIINLLKEDTILSHLDKKNNRESLINDLLSIGYIIDLFTCISKDFISISNTSTVDLSLLISVTSLLLSTKRLFVYYEKLIEIDDILASSVFEISNDSCSLDRDRDIGYFFDKEYFFKTNTKRIETILYKNIFELVT